MSRGPGDGEGQGTGRRKRTRAPRPSPSDLSPGERLQRAYRAALRLLAHRERSEAELRARLAAKGFDRETVGRVLEQLQEAGLQDDARFAQALAADAVRSRGLAARAIRGELRRRGIDRALAAEAATRDPHEEEAGARALARKRAAQLASLPAPVRERRVAGLLARRGYPAELCERLARDEE